MMPHSPRPETFMRFPTLVTLIALSGAIAIGATLVVQAQPAPPPPNGPMGRPMGGPMADEAGPGPLPPGMHGPRPGMGPMQHGPGLFGLMYHPEDRKLTPPDVQKIAEAFLLWNGNRTWKVTDVAADGDSRIRFAFATADGGVIARFTMDAKTGRIARLG